MLKATAAAAALLALAGTAPTARAATTMKLQVSPALAEQWTSTLTAHPGDAIDVRVTFSYSGPEFPIGLGGCMFQPVIGGWRSAEGDLLRPMVASGGVVTTPSGVVPDLPGQYGRISPFGAAAPIATSSPLTGHVNVVAGTEYLRIARTLATGWIGTPGNNDATQRGVVTTQLNDVGRTASWPAFNPSLQNVVVFKFGVTLSSTANLRTMLVDAPVDGIYLTQGSQEHGVGWFSNSFERPPTIVDIPTVLTATINVVPAPAGALSLAGLALTPAASRRRRRARPHASRRTP